MQLAQVSVPAKLWQGKVCHRLVNKAHTLGSWQACTAHTDISSLWRFPVQARLKPVWSRLSRLQPYLQQLCGHPLGETSLRHHDGVTIRGGRVSCVLQQGARGQHSCGFVNFALRWPPNQCMEVPCHPALPHDPHVTGGELRPGGTKGSFHNRALCLCSFRHLCWECSSHADLATAEATALFCYLGLGPSMPWFQSVAGGQQRAGPLSGLLSFPHSVISLLKPKLMSHCALQAKSLILYC